MGSAGAQVAIPVLEGIIHKEVKEKVYVAMLGRLGR
jgi:hypothetical protein